MQAVIVEPDRELSRRIAGALGARGWTVLTARGYHDGLALLRRVQAVGVLLVAERLARMSGPDLLATIGRDPALARIPTVLRVKHEASLLARAMAAVGAVITATVDAEAIANALVETASCPFDSRRLRSQANELCARARRNCDRAAALVARTQALLVSSFALYELVERQRRRQRHAPATP
jgi:DNA-binding NtrC family response regulator